MLVLPYTTTKAHALKGYTSDLQDHAVSSEGTEAMHTHLKCDSHLQLMRWVCWWGAAALWLCVFCRCFCWLCSTAGAMLLLGAGGSTAHRQSKDIWALASKDASGRHASR